MADEVVALLYQIDLCMIRDREDFEDDCCIDISLLDRSPD